MTPWFPPKWNKTIDSLDDPDKWLQAWQRSELRPDTIFPRKGQVWEAVRVCGVALAARFATRPSEGQMTLLPKGERVRVTFVDEPRSLAAHLDPLRYDELKESIVPEYIRKAPGYLKYVLMVSTRDLNQNFRLVEDVV